MPQGINILSLSGFSGNTRLPSQIITQHSRNQIPLDKGDERVVKKLANKERYLIVRSAELLKDDKSSWC